MGFFDFLKGASGAIPFVGPVISGIMGGLQTNSENKANREAADLFNQFYGPGGTRETAANDLVKRLTDAGFDPFGPQTTSQYGTNWGSQQGATSSATRGNESSTSRTQGMQQMRRDVDPAQQAMFSLLNQQVQSRLGQPTVTEGEKLRAVAAKNAAYENAMRGAMDTAGMRGVSPAQAGTLGLAQQRAGDIGDYLASVPELERKRQFENEQAAQGLINMMLGSTTTSDSTTNALRNYASNTRGTSNMSSSGGSSGQTVGGPDTGFLANLFMPQSPMAPTNTGVNPWLQAGGDIFAGLTQAMANRNRPNNPMTMPGSYPGSPIDPNVINRRP